MKYFYCLLLVLVSIQLHAQRNLKPGYIVALNGDTTNGFIDVKEWSQNPRSIAFKATAQSATKQYSQANIKAFGVDQFDHYQRYIGPITKGAVDLADLSSGIDSSFVTDSVFLRLIVGGKNLTLYSYTDRIKTRYFIGESNSPTVELKRYVYLDARQSDKIREFNFYTQQLLALAIKYGSDNKALTEDLQKTAYEAQDLERVILKIDGSENQPKRSTAKRAGVSFFAGLSANSNKTTVVEKDAYLGSAKSSNTVTPEINLGLDVYFNKNVGKFIFRTEVGLSTNKVSFDTKSAEVDYLNTYRRDDQLTFNQFTIAISPQLIWNVFNKANFKTYLAAGAQINFTSYSNFKHNIQEYLNQKMIGDNHIDNNYLRATYPNAVFKLGVIISNRFDIYAGYNTQQRLGNYSGKTYSFNIDSYRAGVNYLFGKK
jgi:hypothetical protein